MDRTRCCGAIVLLALAGCSTGAGVKPLPPTTTTETTREEGKVTRTETETVQATVVAVDQRTRRLTLRNAEGEDVTFRADEQVKNLPQVRKGDLVTAVYKRAIAFRLRKPGEPDAGPKTGSGVATAPPGQKPAIARVNAVQVTTTITDVDRTKQEVTLRGADGKSVTLAVEDPTVLDKVAKGDEVEVTYTEAAVIAVEKP